MSESVFSRNVRDHLNKRGWTQQDLAERLGISQPAVGKYLSGDVKLSTIERVAAALGVSPGNLITPGSAAVAPKLTPEGEMIEVDVSELDSAEQALIAEIRTSPKKGHVLIFCLQVAQHFAAYQREHRRLGYVDVDEIPTNFGEDE